MYPTEMLTDERKGDCKFKQDVVMNDHYLSVLASTTQSDLCAQLLIDSCLPRVLSQAVTEFCLREIQRPGLASPTSPRRQGRSRQFHSFIFQSCSYLSCNWTVM